MAPWIVNCCRYATLALLLCLPGFNSATAANEDLKIPNLGESSTSLFSADYEYELGRMWLRSFRGQAPLVTDPLLYGYLENLVFELVQHSELQDRRIELVIVDNPTIKFGKELVICFVFKNMLPL